MQSSRNTEVGDRFNRTLFAALDALEEGKIQYALIGGVASSGLGRPRSTHDIDVFVRPEDAGSALAALARKGFNTEKTDPTWLFKAFKESILVDIIFKSRGDIYFDSEMNEHTKLVEYHGRKVRTVNPADLIIIKCAVHDERGPHHWHDALALLSHAPMDWDYLVKRARRAPRRLLSLLLYAQSNDIWIPNKVIFELFRIVFGEEVRGAREANPVISIPKRVPAAYVVAHVTDALAKDPRTGEQNIKVNLVDNRVVLRGEVNSDEQRRMTEQVTRDSAEGFEIDNELIVSSLPETEGVEEVG